MILIRNILHIKSFFLIRINLRIRKYSLDVAKVLGYIKVNILKNPSIDDCLKYINKGRTSFLTTFKNEVGITLGKYITKTRLNETKIF